MLSSAGTHRHYGAADLPPTSRRSPVGSASEPLQSKGVGGSDSEALLALEQGKHVGADDLGARAEIRGGIGGTLALAPAPALALSGP